MLHELAILAALAAAPDQEAAVARPVRTAALRDRPVAATYNGYEGQTNVVAPRLADPAINLDGRLDEAAWSEAALLTGFSQFDPSEGIPATQDTEVLLLISEDAVYFGVRAFDDNPGGVRATLGERDTFYRTDDYIQFILDTFNDQRQAYSIVVNPLGVQQDGLWIEGRVGRFGRNFGPPIDWNPDFVWDSEGRVEDWGYAVEVRIPFKSIRFPEAAEQAWGLQVFRKIQRLGFDESWAPVTKDVANRLTLAGSLSGLRDLERGLFLELNPVVTGTRQGTYDAGAKAFTREPVSGEFGFNAKYGLTSNLTLDGTYNPDFSQVEADAGQIAVNERFALFYEEKRPFFLEGTEIFTMPKNLVYTRSIVNPVAGAKLSGKAGSFQLGYLGAVDEVAGSGEPARRPVVNLLRARRDLGNASTLGMVYTDRSTSGDEYNRVFGIDGRFVMARRYTLTVIGAGSRTATVSSGPETGSYLSLQLERASPTLTFNIDLEDVAHGFDAGSGLIPRVGDTRLQSRLEYNFRGEPGALVEQFRPGFDASAFWDHESFWRRETFEEAEIRYGVTTSFRNNITVLLAATARRYDFRAADYDGLYVDDGRGGEAPFVADQDPFGLLHGVGGFLWVNSWDVLRGRVRWGYSQDAVFDLRYGVPIEVGTGWNADIAVYAYPTRHLSAELGFRYQSLFRESDGTLALEAVIPRVKTQYQFSRALFLRAIVEYGAQMRRDLVDPATGHPLLGCGSSGCSLRSGTDANDFGIETLLSYEPTPGTVFFLGYSRQMEDTGRLRFRDVRPTADGLFAKVSYRFRR
ncbi:MAG: DUF5916 domain-containing protein [Gemmatimonadetes bacterium]|nr:DUF5916 domain-containing protein [Gemmatimonadota bacterium]